MGAPEPGEPIETSGIVELPSGRARLPWAILLLAGVIGSLAGGVPVGALAAVALPTAVLVVSRPRYVVLGLAVFMPFEDFILKFLPVSDTVYSASRFLSEATIYIAFAVLVTYHIIRGIPLKRTPIDLPLALFVMVAGLSLVVNRSPIFGSLANLRPFLRYVVFFYFVVNAGLSQAQIGTVVRVVLAATGIQVAIGFLQRVGGEGVTKLFLPRVSVLEIEGQAKSFVLLDHGREIGSVFGTLGDTVIFGVFVLIGLLVYVCSRPKLRLPDMLVIVLYLLAISLSYSRAAVFGALLGLFLWYRVRTSWRRAILLGGVLIVAGGLTLATLVSIPSGYANPRFVQESALGNLTGVFSSQYIEVAQKQRLGALIGNVPTVLVNRPLLGYGPDQDTAIDRLNSSQRSFLLKVWSKEGFKDVYWVAMLTFYGFLGLGTVIAIFARLYRTAWRSYRSPTGPMERSLGQIVICLIGVTSFLLFFNRTVEFRAYGFTFWLICGLLLSARAAGTQRVEGRSLEA